MLGVHLSRLGEEIVLWSSVEFGWARVGDAFSTGSSIMPQKRNPDVAELVRGKAGRLVGDLVSLLDDHEGPAAHLQPRPPGGQGAGLRRRRHPERLALPAIAGTIASLTFDRGAAGRHAAGGFALATDLAEELVRRGVPFREAHEVVGEVVRLAESRGVDLDGLDPEELAAAHPALTPDVADLLDPRSAIDRRDGSNGTATASVRRQLERARGAAGRNAST
jgi:argininosuccinate lyase